MTISKKKAKNVTKSSKYIDNFKKKSQNVAIFLEIFQKIPLTTAREF
jgi:hypothetical protein